MSVTCGAKLDSLNRTYICEREPGHDGEHGGHNEFETASDPLTHWTDDAAGAVLPEAAGETPQTDAEAASDAEDAPGQAETVILCECGHTLEQHDRDTPVGPVCAACKCAGWNPVEEIVQTAPMFEAELVLSSVGVWVQRLPGGGRQLKVLPIRATPNGPQPVYPAYVLDFSNPQAWETFKGVIENDGKPKRVATPKPQIVTATHLPSGAKL